MIGTSCLAAIRLPSTSILQYIKQLQPKPFREAFIVIHAEEKLQVYLHLKLYFVLVNYTLKVTSVLTQMILTLTKRL